MLLLVTMMFLVTLAAMPAYAHEPIFGLGPHTIFKGGVGIETEIETELASGTGETERRLIMDTEFIYGVTTNLSLTVAVPVIYRELEIDDDTNSLTGLGDVFFRTKYRFWRHDITGTQDSAAFIMGIKLPTGNNDSTPQLGSGSTDFLFGLAAARESRRMYYFGDLRYRLNTENHDDLKIGDRLFADTGIGVRPWLTEYLEPDLVVTLESNWETHMRNSLDGHLISDSGGDLLFLSPGFFLTYRNWAIKGGFQYPVYQELNGDQAKIDYRLIIAMEVHI